MRLILVLCLLVSTTSYSQLLSSGAKNEGRVVISETPFVLAGSIDGWAKYDLAIDRKGNVTSAKILETNLTRTSAKLQIRNYVMKMKFTAGTVYPHFHHGTVKVTLVKSDDLPKQPEIVID
ncbi:MAG: hypothetical protein HRT57_08315 [Crocinitomicaceae bacterium]|nr:hypothetical protein [Crocinitomicaceae bacterium]